MVTNMNPVSGSLYEVLRILLANLDGALAAFPGYWVYIELDQVLHSRMGFRGFEIQVFI